MESFSQILGSNLMYLFDQFLANTSSFFQVFGKLVSDSWINFGFYTSLYFGLYFGMLTKWLSDFWYTFSSYTYNFLYFIGTWITYFYDFFINQLNFFYQD